MINLYKTKTPLQSQNEYIAFYKLWQVKEQFIFNSTC